MIKIDLQFFGGSGSRLGRGGASAAGSEVTGRSLGQLREFFSNETGILSDAAQGVREELGARSDYGLDSEISSIRDLGQGNYEVTVKTYVEYYDRRSSDEFTDRYRYSSQSDDFERIG